MEKSLLLPEALREEKELETLWLPTGYGETSPEVPTVVSPRIPAAAYDVAGDTRSTGERRARELGV